MQNIKKDVLELLEKDSRLTNDQLAKLLNVSAEEIKEIIEQLERDNIILRYSTIINWEKHGCQKVTAMIEVVFSQREVGFDKIAEESTVSSSEICLFSIRFYDLCSVGTILCELSHFVEKLFRAYCGTKTNFIMKRYKGMASSSLVKIQIERFVCSY